MNSNKRYIYGRSDSNTPSAGMRARRIVWPRTGTCHAVSSRLSKGDRLLSIERGYFETLISVIKSYSAELPLPHQGQRISKARCKQLAISSVSLGLDHLPICQPGCPSPYKGEPDYAMSPCRQRGGTQDRGWVSVQGLGWSGEVMAQVHDNP